MFDMFDTEYYNSLPEDIKESVRECGLIFDTETELREYVVGIKGWA